MLIRWRDAILLVLLGACGPVASRRGATVMYASGADLQSINPLFSVHPLARQVQRYLLLTTLIRYDSTLAPEPYLARSWRWSPDRTRLSFALVRGLRWEDGESTVAADVQWTLEAARDPVVGYPRQSELQEISAVDAPNDSTVEIHFRRSQSVLPDVLTDLAILPKHCLDSVPRDRLRSAAWNTAPVGNGPFAFVSHEPNRRWVFRANREFPAELGGPPRLDRLVLAVVDEPATKLAALTSGELDFAGIQPAHAAFVERNPELAVRDYPLLFTYGLVFNLRRPPFTDVAVRRRISGAIDRAQIVQGYLYGFATPADGPIPPGIPAPPAVTPAASVAQAGSAPVHFELLTVGSGEAALEQMLQAELAQAGIEVTIRQLELTAFLDRVQGPTHDFDAAVMGIPGDLQLGYLAPLARLTGLEVPEAASPKALLRLFSDSVPVAFLYHARGLQGLNRRVHGVVLDVRGELASVHDWWVTP